MLESFRSDRSRPRLRLALTALVGLAVGSAAALGQGTPVERSPPPPEAVPSQPPPPPTPQPPPAPTPEATLAVLDSHVYEVSALVIRYAAEHPDMPAVEQLTGLDVTLSLKDGVYVSPRPGLTALRLTLGDLITPQREPRRFAASALNAIASRIVEFFNQRGLVGVAVIPPPSQIDPRTLEDLRPPEQRTLVMDIWVRTVAEVRTLGAGPRWDRPTAPGGRPSLETRVNHPYHLRIRENSPAQPGDLLRKEEIEEHIARLERHPGRRLDATVSAGERPGEVSLDYVITENRPWTAYFQLSNTGTEETGEWRQRFGFVHYQLSHSDDILSVDYITAGFDDVHALLASYDAPLFGSPVTRWRAYGSITSFTAADVGFVGEDFDGDSWQVGAELATNVVQRGRAFVDLFGGARWQYVHVNNEASALEDRDHFFIPYVGARFERSLFRATTNAEVRLETNLPGVAGTDSDLNGLGRLGADDDWTVLKWSVGHSFYLEPLLFRQTWSSPEAPYRKTTLAHEIALSLRGQHAFGNALIPQEQDTIGGLYTVRGYEEAAVAGDNVYIASAEYRFHLPRWLEPGPPTTFMRQPFRVRPEQRWGRPDWDLIFRGFVDVGRATGENLSSETLVGTGVGAELVILRNLSLRVDVGMAMKDARETNSGETRVHFVGTILY